MKDLCVFGIFLTVRLVSVYLVQTFFVPDEYWQSLEVAHKFSFGYGYLTWEWQKGIRSYIYPLIFTSFYSGLKYLHLDGPLTLIYGPRILQAVLSSYADLSFYRWSGQKKWAIFCMATSWFWFYTASRTLINSFEAALTTITLSKFPWWGQKVESFKFIWIIALACIIRPTAAIIYLPLCGFHLLTTRLRPTSLILTQYLPRVLLTLIGAIILDSIAHGSLLITPLEFFKFNIFKGLGSFYGTQPWHWYLSTGFPTILGIYFIPFICASFSILKSRDSHPNELALLGTIVFSLAVYSCLPHKEFRFLLPLLPISMYISTKFLAGWSRKANYFVIWTVVAFLLLGNLVPVYYVGVKHQSGTLEVMSHLREIAGKDTNNTSLLFLMPCHSTPYYSHLHVNVTSRFLTCNPNFNDVAGYVDEADFFYKNPSGWLRNNYPPTGSLPSHIICFDVLQAAISDILSRYKTIAEISHTDFPTARVGHKILINERLG